MVRVNAGCGWDYREGWINLDLVMRPGEKRDVIADVRRLPFKDESVDHILMSHTFEHFTVEEGMEILRECWRVLKPGGFLEIVCPNAIYYAKRWLKSADDINALHSLIGDHSLGPEFGHKMLYDPRNLPRVVESAGFKIVGVYDDVNVSVHAIKEV